MKLFKAEYKGATDIRGSRLVIEEVKSGKQITIAREYDKEVDAQTRAYIKEYADVEVREVIYPEGTEDYWYIIAS